MKFFISFILGLFFSLDCFSCDCDTSISTYELRNHAYDQSKYIVLAEITNIDKTYFDIDIYEYFKGTKNNIDSLRVAIDGSCSFTPNFRDNLWILYIQDKKGKFIVDYCMPNRSISKRTILDQLKNPNLPKLCEEDTKILKKIHLDISINEELSWLRYKNILTNFHQDEKNEYGKTKAIKVKEFNLLILLILILVILLQLTILFKRKK